MRVEGDRHVQQDFALLHAANKVLDSVFELVGGLVNLLWVTLSRLCQLLGRLQQLVCIGVRVLHREQGEGGRGKMNSPEKNNATQTKKKKIKYILTMNTETQQKQVEDEKQDMQKTRTLIVSDSRAALR